MIYLYKCTACEKVLEREFPIATAPDTITSICDANGVDAVCKRVFTAVPAIWKTPTDSALPNGQKVVGTTHAPAIERAKEIEKARERNPDNFSHAR